MYKNKTLHNKENNQQSQETNQRAGNSTESNTSDKRLASKKHKDPEQLSSKKQESWLKHYQVICTDVSQWRCMNGLWAYEKVFSISNYQTMQIKAAREGSASHHRMTTMEGRNTILHMALQKSKKNKNRHCRHLMAFGCCVSYQFYFCIISKGTGVTVWEMGLHSFVYYSISHNSQGSDMCDEILFCRGKKKIL